MVVRDRASTRRVALTAKLQYQQSGYRGASTYLSSDVTERRERTIYHAVTTPV